MPANTTNGYPYPVAGDPVQQARAGIQSLAEKVDTALRASAAGTVVVSVTAAATGVATVAYPVGRFVSAEVSPVATVNGNAAYFAVVSNLTATSMQVTVVHRAGTSATTTVRAEWNATARG